MRNHHGNPFDLSFWIWLDLKRAWRKLLLQTGAGGFLLSTEFLRADPKDTDWVRADWAQSLASLHAQSRWGSASVQAEFDLS
jgi:hypothetical protein